MSTLPKVGDEFAGYLLRGVIGRGGMSVVFQAENPRLGNLVALKVLAPELAANDVFRTRFLQESRVAASLNHPNVVPIYDVGPSGDLLYIAMRYVAGTDLRALLEAEGQLPPDEALFIAGQAARALDAAHRMGLVHRDVKPGNILIERGTDDDPDHAYLADFGITKHAMSRSRLTVTGEFIATIDYVAPEQIRSGAVDGRADQYSLGCVLYECLTGRVPFEKDSDAAVIWAHVEELPPMPSTLRPELPRRLDDVFTRVLAKQAADRYPSCREFVEAAWASFGDQAAELPAFSMFREHPRAGRSAAATSAAGEAAAGDSNGSPPASGDRPPGSAARQRRRSRLSRSALAVGALALVVGAGAFGGWLAAASSKPAKPPPHMHMTQHPNSVLPVLAHANAEDFGGPYSAKGLLRPSTCRAQGTSIVTCVNPVPEISTVTFRLYPSLSTLYSAYVAKVKSLAGSYAANTGDCNWTHDRGEASWTHHFVHPHKYSLEESRSGMSMASGRFFCTITPAGDLAMVWTQDDGRLLASLVGAPHEDAYRWWVSIHHNLAFKNSGHMHM
jgi:serine/threonine protein kinase